MNLMSNHVAELSSAGRMMCWWCLINTPQQAIEFLDIANLLRVFVLNIENLEACFYKSRMPLPSTLQAVDPC
jgi:hypothetical protein